MKSFFSAFKLILTLKCEHSTHIVSQSLDRELPFAERWAVRLHNISCRSCRRFGKQIRQLRHSLQLHPERTPNDAGLSTEALHRIEDAIRREG